MSRKVHTWSGRALGLGALLLTAGSIASGFAGSAMAQGYGYGGRIPGGSWTQVCRSGYMDGRFLFRASCLNKNGEWRDASLDMRQCPSGVVSSQSAYLQCGYGPSTAGRTDGPPWAAGYNAPYYGYHGGDHGGAFAGYNLPPGPWRNECRNAWVDGHILRATCLNRHQEWRDASLDLRNCDRGDRVYADGAYLRCD